MYRDILAIAAILSALALGATAARSEEAHVTEVKRYIAANVQHWLRDRLVIDTIKAQNARNAVLSETDIEQLDKDWTTQLAAAQQPLIEGVLKNALSVFLRQKQQASRGLITEIFVMDNRGLNVGQSDITSDYWQGDEDKWLRSFNNRTGGIDVGRLSFDKSANANLQQLSFPIIAPDGSVIGAITFGIDLDRLEAAKETNQETNKEADK